MGLVLFLLVFVLCSQTLAFAIALIARQWVWRTPPIVLAGIEPMRARSMVAAYLESVNDTRFGFPTGVFRVKEDSSGPTRLVAQELDFSGSTALDLGRFALSIPAGFVAAASDEGCLAGLIALTLAVTAAVFLVVPMLLVGLVDVVLRWLMRSRIVAVLEPAADQESCTVSFELTGLSAYGLRRSLLSGLSKPVLPARWGGSVARSEPERWFDDRLNMVYASGSAIAVITAIAVISTASGSSSPTGFQPARPSQEETSTTEASGESASTETQSASTETGSESESVQTESTTSSPNLADNVTKGNGFTIQRPAGNWVRDHLELQKTGYIETRWHLAGSPNIVFLIDHTPGYSGSARSGAEGVMAPYAHVSSYRKLSFAAETLPAGEAWRWEYEVDGKRSVDTFIVVCNTGYAVLGSSPPAQWAHYAQAFDEATSTLTPECD